MSENKPRRKLAAILAADVVGFSKLMGKNEDRTLKNLKASRTITDESIVSNHGRIFGSAGDSIIAEFASPVDAIVAATEFQRSLKQRNQEVDEEHQMKFRVGLNLGDVIIEDEISMEMGSMLLQGLKHLQSLAGSLYLVNFTMKSAGNWI